MSATKNFTLNENFQPVAQGPGSALVQLLDSDGEWTIISSLSPAGITAWNRIFRLGETSLELLAGEYLHLRGRGTCSVLADAVL
jgi:hypothetical protein